MIRPPSAVVRTADVTEILHAFAARVRDWTDEVALQRAADDALHALLGAGVAYVEPRGGDTVLAMPAPGEPRVPVLTPSGVWGTIRLVRDRATGASDHDLNVATVVAGQLGVALHAGPLAAQQTRQVDALTVRLREVTTLAALSEGFVRGKDLGRVLQRVVEGTVELMNCEIATVLLRHATQPALEVVAATGGRARDVLGDLVPIDRSLAGWVVQTGMPRACMNPLVEPLAYRDSGDKAGIHNHLIVPLWAEGEPIGVLTVSNRRAPGAYTAHDIELLSDLAKHAEAAIESSRVLETLRRKVAESTALSEVGRAVTGTLALHDVLALVVREAEALIDGECACVALRTEAGDELRVEAATGILRRDEGLRLPLVGSIMGWAVVNASTAVTENIADDPRTQKRAERAGPGIVVPLRVGREVRGALLVARAEGGAPIGADDADALEQMAAFSAVAIENARLHARAEAALAHAREKQAELERAYNELRTSQEQLLVSDKMAALGRITAGIAHEINSPLGGILNGLEVVRGYAEEYRASIGDPDVLPDDHRAIAGDMLDTLALTESATRKVAQFVRSIKAQTRLGEWSADSRFDPRAEIESTVMLLGHHLRERGVDLVTELCAEGELQGDPGKFGLVVQNLITNAIDAYDAPPCQVAVRTRRDGDALVLEVEDHGCGIPEEIRGRIFDYLFTTKEVGQGTGLGLSMVHSVVTSHFHGEITLQSEVGRGSLFSLRLPLPPPSAG